MVAHSKQGDDSKEGAPRSSAEGGEEDAEEVCGEEDDEVWEQQISYMAEQEASQPAVDPGNEFEEDDEVKADTVRIELLTELSARQEKEEADQGAEARSWQALEKLQEGEDESPHVKACLEVDEVKQ